MSFDPIDNSKNIPGAKPADMPADLPEFTLADIDFEAIERKASIFVKDTKFVPVDEQVKLVSVEKTVLFMKTKEKCSLLTARQSLLKLNLMMILMFPDSSVDFLAKRVCLTKRMTTLFS